MDDQSAGNTKRTPQELPARSAADEDEVTANSDNLIDELRDCRTQCAMLLDQLKERASRLIEEYRKAVTEGHVENPNKWKRDHAVMEPSWKKRFSEVGGRIRDLLERTDGELILRSARSAQDRENLRVYRELPFIQNSKEYESVIPDEKTLRGLDQVMELVQAREHREERVKTVDVAAENVAQAGGPQPAVAGETHPGKGQRREPHPDPDKLLGEKMKVNRQTAAKLLGVTERRVRELVSEGKLKVLGEGHTAGISVESLRVRLGISTNSEPPGSKRQ